MASELFQAYFRSPLSIVNYDTPTLTYGGIVGTGDFLESETQTFIATGSTSRAIKYGTTQARPWFENCSDTPVIVLYLGSYGTVNLMGDNGVPNSIVLPGQTLSYTLDDKTCFCFLIVDTRYHFLGSFYYDMISGVLNDISLAPYHPLYVFPGVPDATGLIQFSRNVVYSVKYFESNLGTPNGFLMVHPNATLQLHLFSDKQIVSRDNGPTLQNLSTTHSNPLVTSTFIRGQSI